jgi:hypothetical protein
MSSENFYLEAKALALSVATTRKARGKGNPSDFSVDSEERQLALLEFASDVLAVVCRAKPSAERNSTS